MAWTIDKRACKALYFSLQRADQIDLQTKFMEAGILKMKNLIFYNLHSSAELRKVEAIMLSVKLNNEFKKTYLANFENDETETTSVSKMSEIMLVENKSVEDLSDVVDHCYKFRDEL